MNLIIEHEAWFATPNMKKDYSLVGKGPRQHVGLSLNKADLKFPGSKPAKKQSIILIVSPTYLGKTTDDEDYWDWIAFHTISFPHTPL